MIVITDDDVYEVDDDDDDDGEEILEETVESIEVEDDDGRCIYCTCSYFCNHHFDGLEAWLILTSYLSVQPSLDCEL